MTQGHADNKPLQSSDRSKVDVEAGALLSKDLTTNELLVILILEIRDLKEMLSTLGGN